MIGVPFVEAVVTLQSASEVDHADAASEDAGWEIENALRHAFCALMGPGALAILTGQVARPMPMPMPRGRNGK